MRLIEGRKLIVLLLFALPLICIAGVIIGPINISLAAIFAEPSASQDWIIVREIRLPRVILSGIVGAVLAISGAVLQGLFRNPLADPGLIGVSAGASVGASTAIFLGAGLFAVSGLGGLSIIALGAFVGGICTVWMVYRLATSSDGTSVSTMLLVGIAVTTFAAALNTLLGFLADNEMLRRMSMWQMGNLDLAGWNRVLLCSAMLTLFLLLLRGNTSALNAMLLGESEARHLGIDITRTKKRLIFLTALGVGTSAALAGTIAFVGLIIPHMVRIIAGPDHRYLLPASGLMGACLLILADIIARLVLAPAELPVGIITAFLGVPFFIYLLRQHRRL